MLKFCAGIVLYNPTEDNISNIIKYTEEFQYVIVYDNSTEATFDRNIFIDRGIFYFRTGKNEGISKAINYIIDFCIENEIDFLCTLDQDSIFESCNIKKMKEYLERICYADIAIVAPRILYIGGKKSNCRDEISEVEWVITSGSFINIKLINEKEIRYDEKYFIDRCDRDFCKQARMAGMRILINNQSVMIQELGEEAPTGKRGHGVLRHYYCFRNRFYYNQKYYVGLERIARDCIQTIRQLYRIIVWEDDRIAKIRMLKRAIRDYRKGNMFAYEE